MISQKQTLVYTLLAYTTKVHIFSLFRIFSKSRILGKLKFGMHVYHWILQKFRITKYIYVLFVVYARHPQSKNYEVEKRVFSVATMFLLELLEFIRANVFSRDSVISGRKTNEFNFLVYVALSAVKDRQTNFPRFRGFSQEIVWNNIRTWLKEEYSSRSRQIDEGSNRRVRACLGSRRRAFLYFSEWKASFSPTHYPYEEVLNSHSEGFRHIYEFLVEKMDSREHEKFPFTPTSNLTWARKTQSFNWQRLETRIQW